MISPQYRAQVELLLRVLPYVAKEKIFALKGGTAINMFVRNLPRLSVDIDLTYLLSEDRHTALRGIADGLTRIKDDLAGSIPGIKVTLLPQSDGQEAKLSCKLGDAEIKIEVNTTLRGYLQKPRMMPVVDAVVDEFDMFAVMNVISQGELYGGKICAALDRQHPRDLFDVHQLFENEGITDEIRTGFIALLVGQGRPIHEMLQPNLLDQRELYATHFQGMTAEPYSYANFETTRDRLIKEINTSLSSCERRFLISLKEGEPEWSLYPLAGLEGMGAVNWKLLNIRRLRDKNPGKHAEQLGKLKAILEVED